MHALFWFHLYGLSLAGFVLEDSELHLGFFRCFGRVIALAIIHKVQVGVTFDMVLFRQLAGLTIELEHIRDTSPENYKLYPNILFKCGKDEIEDMQLPFLVKFGGDADPKKGNLTDDNKEDFVRHMLHLEYEESIKDAISEIICGFDVVLTYSVRRLFLQIIRLGDLDLMLRGVSNLDVQQWRSHTVYVGYTPSDLCIDWFWQCVGDMSEEEKLELFNFWTGTRWLPVGGFRELDPVLIIQMVPSTAEEKLDRRRPVAHTCYRSLSFPPYQSLEVMREHLYEIVTFYSQSTLPLSFFDLIDNI